ncbi:HdeD family acid-resistance protein [Leifsonia sp. 2TAF2]|uniref:HdeD family acid-resistance protein n=1 Tax=Leifsonia sp. 2TAF2 TaxID=3233009 RepID=UPI003F99C248
MSATDPIVNELSLNARDMTRSAINAVRTALGVSGGVSLILGIVLLFWPEKTLSVLAVFLGIYFLIAGVLRLAIGIFAHGLRGGSRVLNIILGVLLIFAGILALKNISAAAVTLVIFAVAFIGVAWIIEGVMALAEAGRAASSGWAIAFGILSIIAGIVVLVLPASSAVFLLWFAAFALIVLGVIGIVRAFTFGRDVLKATDSPATAPRVA